MIPKNFIPNKTRKSGIKELKPLKKTSLGDLIVDEKELGYTNKFVDYPSAQSNYLIHRGITPEFVKDTIWVRYMDTTTSDIIDSIGPDTPDILLIEYNSQPDLQYNFLKIFEAGLKSYGSSEKFKDIFLFKDNISIFIHGDALRKKAVPYYRKLEFKQLKCVFEGE